MNEIENQESMTACEMIKTALKQERLHQKDLAERIGKSTPALSMQLNSGYMSAEEWRRMADALGYEVIMRRKKSRKSPE